MAGTILCVDADRQQCGILERALKDHGYRVTSANDGKEALARIQQGGLDLVISDFAVPRRDGLSLLEATRELPAPLADLPFVYTTSTRPSDEKLSRAKQLKAKAIVGKPIAIDRLMGLVAKHVDAGQPASASAPPPARRKASQLAKAAVAAREAPLPTSDSAPQIVSGAMRLEGKLRESPLPFLLHRIYELRATGVLILTNGNKKKALQLREGYPVAVKSNLVGECLGNYLVKQGVITARAFDESTARLKKGQGLQGEILVAMDVLEEEDVSRALVEQALEKLYELFEWRGGRFKFEVGGRLRKANSLALDRSPGNVIFEGVRQRYPIERIDGYLQRYLDSWAAPCDEPFKKLQEVELGENEVMLLERLQERPRVSELMHETERERRALFGLLATGMVELHQSASGAAAAAVGEPTSLVDDVSSGVAQALADAGAPAASVGSQTLPKTPPARERRGTPGVDVSLTNPLPQDDRELRAELAATAEKLRREDLLEIEKRFLVARDHAALATDLAALLRRGVPARDGGRPATDLDPEAWLDGLALAGHDAGLPDDVARELEWAVHAGDAAAWKDEGETWIRAVRVWIGTRR